MYFFRSQQRPLPHSFTALVVIISCVVAAIFAGVVAVVVCLCCAAMRRKKKQAAAVDAVATATAPPVAAATPSTDARAVSAMGAYADFTRPDEEAYADFTSRRPGSVARGAGTPPDGSSPSLRSWRRSSSALGESETEQDPVPRTLQSGEYDGSISARAGIVPVAVRLSIAGRDNAASGGAGNRASDVAASSDTHASGAFGRYVAPKSRQRTSRSSSCSDASGEAV